MNLIREIKYLLSPKAKSRDFAHELLSLADQFNIDKDWLEDRLKRLIKEENSK